VTTSESLGGNAIKLCQIAIKDDPLATHADDPILKWSTGDTVGFHTSTSRGPVFDQIKGALLAASALLLLDLFNA
jgi:hypothetical protein